MNVETHPQRAHKHETVDTLACIVHDFKNILSAIIGLTELAVVNIDDKTYLQNKLKKVLKAGHQARGLANHILGTQPMCGTSKKPVWIKGVIKEDLKFFSAALPTTIEIRQKIESDKMVTADPIQIHQIVTNLVIKAVHAMGKAGGVLEVSLTDVEFNHCFAAENPGVTPGQHICLSVSDDGHGMSCELKKNI